MSAIGTSASTAKAIVQPKGFYAHHVEYTTGAAKTNPYFSSYIAHQVWIMATNECHKLAVEYANARFWREQCEARLGNIDTFRDDNVALLAQKALAKAIIAESAAHNAWQSSSDNVDRMSAHAKSLDEEADRWSLRVAV